MSVNEFNVRCLIAVALLGLLAILMAK